ncbi:hypothetical protein [Actinosynnema sp.]|uniref:hypothetical protein n=1 Tax=Actinosynnema sp. TaxID=1872144 RepID=UPI003F87BE3D
MNWEKIGAVAGVASAALAIVGLVVALIAWLAPQSPDATPSATTGGTAPDTSAARDIGLPSATSGTGTTAQAAFTEVYRDRELVLPAGALGVRTFVDLDKPSVRSAGAPAPDALEKSAEFNHTDTDEFSTTLADDRAAVGFAGGAATPEQCSDAATTSPISRQEKVGPGTKVDVGARLCAVTGEGAVALVVVAALGPETVFSRSVTLRATLWRR